MPPNENAIKQFFGCEQVRFGDEIQIALPPPGRDGSASVGVGDEAAPSIIYSCSHRQGLYDGLALDCKCITATHDCRKKNFFSR